MLTQVIDVFCVYSCTCHKIFIDHNETNRYVYPCTHQLLCVASVWGDCRTVWCDCSTSACVVKTVTHFCGQSPFFPIFLETSISHFSFSRLKQLIQMQTGLEPNYQELFYENLPYTQTDPLLASKLPNTTVSASLNLVSS